MIEIRRILVPVDFSDYSRRALDHAVAIARWYGSSVTVLHVFSATPVAAYAPGAPGFQSYVLTDDDRAELVAGIQRFIDEEAAPGVPIEPLLREGPAAAAEILHEVERLGADLLVMGTHGRSGFERFLLGSITEKVLRKATCPVLTVPRAAPDAAPTPPLFKRILFPLDFSPASTRALDYALSLAKEADATLTLLHVVAPDLEVWSEPAVGGTLADYLRLREKWAQEKLDASVPAEAAEYCTIERILTRGRPGDEIVRIAQEQQTELIVIGVQGRGRLDLALFGSTTQHVVRNADCPVLTIRAA